MMMMMMMGILERDETVQVHDKPADVVSESQLHASRCLLCNMLVQQRGL